MWFKSTSCFLIPMFSQFGQWYVTIFVIPSISILEIEIEPLSFILKFNFAFEFCSLCFLRWSELAQVPPSKTTQALHSMYSLRRLTIVLILAEKWLLYLLVGWACCFLSIFYTLKASAAASADGKREIKSLLILKLRVHFRDRFVIWKCCINNCWIFKIFYVLSLNFTFFLLLLLFDACECYVELVTI
jgi:hypothetical protein